MLSLAPSVASAKNVATVSTKQGELHAFVRGGSGHLLWTHWSPGNGWVNWADLGGDLEAGADIAAITRGANQIHVYVKWADGSVRQLGYSLPGGWGSWYNHGGVINGGVGAAAFSATEEILFGTDGSNGLIARMYNTSSGWGSWFPLGECIRSGTNPQASTRQDGTVDIAVAGCWGGIYVKSYRPGTGWTPASQLSGTGQSTSIAIGSIRDGNAASGRQDYVYKTDDNSAIHQISSINGGFSGPNGLGAPAGGLAAGWTPSTIWWTDADGTLRFDVFAVGNDGNIKQRTWRPTGWQDWGGTIPGHTSTDPAYSPDSVPFMEGACKAANRASGSEVGLSVGYRPTLIWDNPARRKTFYNVMRCLRGVNGGAAPHIRVQMPIDANRRNNWNLPAETIAFRHMVDAMGDDAKGIISIVGHDLAACGAAVQVSSVGATGLGSCEHPNVQLYGEMFSEIAAIVGWVPGNPPIMYSPWNEPDHPIGKIMNSNATAGATGYAPGTGERGAYLAGQYYARAAGVLGGTSRLLAGEFAKTTDSRTTAYTQGANQVPQHWAAHNYSDMKGDTTSFPLSSAFASNLSTRGVNTPIWQLEIGCRIDNGDCVGPDGTDRSYTAGSAARSRLGQAPGTKLFLYELSTASIGPLDHDSALTDDLGRARPVLCGLAGIHGGLCDGNTASGG